MYVSVIHPKLFTIYHFLTYSHKYILCLKIQHCSCTLQFERTLTDFDNFRHRRCYKMMVYFLTSLDKRLYTTLQKKQENSPFQMLC